MPESVVGKKIVTCDPAAVSSDIVFSALDSGVAGEAELAFARRARFVLSNAKNHRMAPDVPLVIAEVNPGHLACTRDAAPQTTAGRAGGDRHEWQLFDDRHHAGAGADS